LILVPFAREALKASVGRTAASFAAFFTLHAVLAGLVSEKARSTWSFVAGVGLASHGAVLSEAWIASLALGGVETDIATIDVSKLARDTSLGGVVKEVTVLAGLVMSFTFSTLISVFTFNTNI